MASKWQKTEVEYIKDNYSRGKAEEMALHLGRSVHAVRRVANELGLCNSTKKWTQDDSEYIKAYYPDKSVPLVEMAKHLGCSIPALKTAAQRMKIFRKYVPDAFCADCGELINKWHHAERCIICSNKHRSGENHSNWQGGVSTLTDIIRRALYPVWTYPVMERDNFTCQYCGHYRDNHVHHLSPLKSITDEVLSDHPELSIDNIDDKIKLVSLVLALHKLEDGITVCKSCHISIHYSEKSGELLGTPNANGEGNQQPSPPKLKVIVGGKVQRLTGEDSVTDKPDTSARHPESATG